MYGFETAVTRGKLGVPPSLFSDELLINFPHKFLAWKISPESLKDQRQRTRELKKTKIKKGNVRLFYSFCHNYFLFSFSSYFCKFVSFYSFISLFISFDVFARENTRYSIFTCLTGEKKLICCLVFQPLVC